jgi:ubiquinone/menaquinone biosynthesis C-methylase UbiE
VKLFRSGPPPHQTALAMVGAKAGSTVIVVGARDPALTAEIALVTGLNGRTLVVDPSGEERSRIEAAAANAGALVDIETAPLTSLPLADGASDVAVITDLGDASSRDQIVREAARVVRPGGRVVVIEGKKTGGLRKLWTGGGSSDAIAADQILAVLSAVGLRATRLLGSAEGISYFEGTKH